MRDMTREKRNKTERHLEKNLDNPGDRRGHQRRVAPARGGHQRRMARARGGPFRRGSWSLWVEGCGLVRVAM